MATHSSRPIRDAQRRYRPIRLSCGPSRPTLSNRQKKSWLKIRMWSYWTPKPRQWVPSLGALCRPLCISGMTMAWVSTRMYVCMYVCINQLEHGHVWIIAYMYLFIMYVCMCCPTHVIYVLFLTHVCMYVYMYVCKSMLLMFSRRSGFNECGCGVLIPVYCMDI